jgi:Ca-activated chloride channel family protein
MNQNCVLTFALFAVLLCSMKMSGQVDALPSAERGKFSVIATKKGQPVTDLRKEELQLVIGKQSHSISALTFGPSQPMRVGLLIDASGSQKTTWNSIISLASGFLRHAINPGGEAFIAIFGDRTYMDARPTTNFSLLEEGLGRLVTVTPHGGTALYDALLTACSLGEAGGPYRRVLVVVTDGQDNASRYTLAETMAVIEKTRTQLFFMGTFPDHPSGSVHRGFVVLRSMADATGGEVIPTSNVHQLEPAFDTIAALLHAEYTLEFQPDGVSAGKDANRIKITCSRRGVKIAAPETY